MKANASPRAERPHPFESGVEQGQWVVDQAGDAELNDASSTTVGRSDPSCGSVDNRCSIRQRGPAKHRRSRRQHRNRHGSRRQAIPPTSQAPELEWENVGRVGDHQPERSSFWERSGRRQSRIRQGTGRSVLGRTAMVNPSPICATGILTGMTEAHRAQQRGSSCVGVTEPRRHERQATLGRPCDGTHVAPNWMDGHGDGRGGNDEAKRMSIAETNKEWPIARWARATAATNNPRHSTYAPSRTVVPGPQGERRTRQQQRQGGRP